MSGHGVNALDKFDLGSALESSHEGAANGYDKLDSQDALHQLNSEETALAALRAYAEPGNIFDVDKVIVACAAYRYHTQK